MSSKNYDIAFKLAAKMDKSYSHAFNMAEEIASKTVGKLAKAAAAIGGAVLSIDKIKECTEKAMGFESAMADVSKVVDGLRDSSGNATAAYKKMSREILDMTSFLPMTGEELAQITAAAGQAGIAAEELTEFTETASKMGVAFDVTANQAGDWMAQWRASFKMSQSEVAVLADQINYLSNTSTENAVKLSEVVGRIGSLGEISGISAAEVAAISASMTGVTAEISATGIKNLMKAMNAGDAATNKQTAVLIKLGLSASEMARRMQTDAQGAIIDLLSAFERLPDAEKSAALTQYFGSESVAAIAPLLANLENLETQFQKVGDASLYAGSMETEFATRAATTENKMKLTQNAIDKLQISIGNLFLPLIGKSAELLAGVVGGFTDKVPVYANKIEKVTKKLWKTVEPLFNWVKKNPALIAQFIGGIGAAITAYKVVDGVKGFTEGLKGLSFALTANPIALGLGAAAAAVAFFAIKIAEANRKLKAENLAAHFGDISLSMAEVEDVAKSIVRTDNLDKISESLKAFDGMDEIQASLTGAIDELNKMNWKVSIGLELTKPEIENYKENINSFVLNAQELLLQEQYAVNLAMNVFVSDTEEGRDIAGWVNKFYLDNQNDLAELGSSLQQTVNDAFNGDGVLSMDEVTEITNLQRQVSEITEKMAKSQFEAKMEVLGLNFSGAALTGESFKALQESIGAEVQKAAGELDEALVMTIASAKVMYEDGFIDAEDYKKYVNEYKQNYLENLGEITLRASSFQTNTILDTYGAELKAAMSEFQLLLTDSLNSIIENIETDDEFRGIDICFISQEIASFKELDSATRQNITDMFESMKPTLEELTSLQNSYIEAGRDIPESLNQGILEIVELGAITGDIESFFTLLCAAVDSDNPNFAAMMEQLQAAGVSIPESLIKGMALQYDVLEKSALAMSGHFMEATTTELEKGLDVTIPIRATADYKLNLDSIMIKDSAPTDLVSLFLNSKVDGYANGSSNTSRTFIAGERGPELITNAAGSKVFTATETSGILNGLSRFASAFSTMFDFDDGLANYDNLLSSDDEPSKLQPFYDAASYNDSSFEINFNPEIRIEGDRIDAADIERQIDDLMEKQFSVFKRIVKDVLEEKEERELRLSNA